MRTFHKAHKEFLEEDARRARVVEEPSETPKGLSDTTKRSIALFVGASGTVIVSVFLVYLVFVRRVDETVHTRGSVCESRACLLYAYYLQKSMDVKRDPCDDFYEYVCASWTPPRKMQRSVGEALFERVMSGVRSKAKDHEPAARHKATKKAANMLTSCLIAKDHVRDNVASLSSFMRRNNISWPDPPQLNVHPLEVLISLASKWRTEFVFRLALHSSNRTLIVLFYPGAHLKDFADIKISERQFSAYVQMHAELFDNASISRADIDELVKIQKVVKASMNVLKRTLRDTSLTAVFPIGSLKNYSKGLVGADTWLSFLNKHVHSGDQEKKGDIEESDLFLMTDTRLFEALDKLLGISRGRLLSYIGWKFVERFGVVLSPAIADLRYEEPKEQLGLYCCTLVEETFGQALTGHYTMAKITDEGRSQIDHFLGDVSAATLHLLGKTSWTGEVARRKISTMSRWMWVRGKTGYASTLDRLYFSFPARPGSFTESWVQSNVALWQKSNSHDYIQYDASSYPSRRRYLHYVNAAVLPSTLMFKPMYEVDHTLAINYAGLGTVFAEVMAHAFDYSGIMFGSGGRLESWMSGQALEAYKKNLKCYGDVQNTRTMWGSVGLEAAFAALQSALSKRNLRSQTLVNFTSYSSDKIFYMAYCFAACGSSSSEDAYSVRSKDTCNYALQQSKHFSDTFNCSLGKKMNPQNKCSFWK